MCTQGYSRGRLGVQDSPNQSRASPSPQGRHWGAALHSGTKYGSGLCPEDGEVGAWAVGKQYSQRGGKEQQFRMRGAETELPVEWAQRAVSLW